MPTPTTNLSGYKNGSDLIIFIGTKAVGHCTSHTVSFSTETKDVAVKPAASVAAGNAGLFKSKRVTGLGVQIKADGLGYYNEAESGLADVISSWKVGQHVTVKASAREHDANPYLTGNFIISSIEQNDPAGEDETYSITLDNDGPVEIDTTKLDLLASASA